MTDTDFEDSAAVFIAADSESDALCWGCRVAEEFVAWQYAGQGDQPGSSWIGEGFVHWIEIEPDKAFSPEQLSQVPVIGYGENPDMQLFEQCGVTCDSVRPFQTKAGGGKP